VTRATSLHSALTGDVCRPFQTPTVSRQFAKRFPMFYGNRELITVFTKPFHWPVAMSHLDTVHVLTPIYLMVQLNITVPLNLTNTLIKLLHINTSQPITLSQSIMLTITYLANSTIHKKKKLNSVASVRERTIPPERSPLVGEVVPTFADREVSSGQRDGSPQPYSRFSRPEPLLFLPSSSSIILT
jgi:hypothetical protein